MSISTAILSGRCTEKMINGTRRFLRSPLSGSNREITWFNTISMSWPEPGWKSEVDWGQLLIDGGAGNNIRIDDVSVLGSSTSGSNTLINTQVDIDVSTGGSYRYEINLVDPNDNTVKVDTYTYTESAGTSSRNFTITFPTSSMEGTYEIQVSLFQVSTGIQESYEPQAYLHSTTSAPRLTSRATARPLSMGTIRLLSPTLPILAMPMSAVARWCGPSSSRTWATRISA